MASKSLKELSEEQLLEFIQLYKKHYYEDLSMAEAREKGMDLIIFLNTLIFESDFLTNAKKDML